jgi:hypothetical protein
MNPNHYRKTRVCRAFGEGHKTHGKTFAMRSSRKHTAKDDEFLSHARQSPFAVRQSWRMAKKNGNGGRPFTNVCHASPLETHGKQNHKNKKKVPSCRPRCHTATDASPPPLHATTPTPLLHATTSG